MKPALTFPDPEREVRDFLAPLMPDVTVGVGVPGDWTPAKGDHLQVSLDGTFMGSWPVAGEATIRLVGWSASTTVAKRIAQEAHGRLLAHTGGGAISRTRPLTGLLPARDFQTGAEQAAVTVRVTFRTVPLPA